MGVACMVPQCQMQRQHVLIVRAPERLRVEFDHGFNNILWRPPHNGQV
jgi:hypothetical protein